MRMKCWGEVIRQDMTHLQLTKDMTLVFDPKSGWIN